MSWWSWKRADEPRSGNGSAYIVPLQETPRVSTPIRPAGPSRWPYQPMSSGSQWPAQSVSPVTPNLVTMPYSASPLGVSSWWPYPANYGAYMTSHFTAAPRPRRPKGHSCQTLSSLSRSSEWTSTGYPASETGTCPQSRVTGRTGWKSLVTRQRRVNVALFVGVLLAVLAIAALGIYIGVSKTSSATTTTPVPVDDIKLTGIATLGGLTFGDGYNDTTSSKYRTLKDGFCKQINKVFRGGKLAQSYKTCSVTGFSPGSVIVHYVLVVVRPLGDIYKSLEVQLLDALNDELERPNSTLRGYLDILNANLTFGYLVSNNPSTTPMMTRKPIITSKHSTPGTTATIPATAGTTTTVPATAGAAITETLTTVTTAEIHTSGKSRDTTAGTTFGAPTPFSETTRTIGANITPTGGIAAGTTEIGSTPAGSTTSGSTGAGSTTTGSATSGSTAYMSTTAETTKTGSATAGITPPTSTASQSVTTDTSTTTRETSTTDVDPCASSPCDNGGTCNTVDGRYRCNCPKCGCSQGGHTADCKLAGDMCVNKTQSLPHPYDCHKYVQCVNSAPLERSCSGGLVFNPNNGACSYLANTACAQPVVTESTTVAVTTTAAVVTTSDTRNCSVVTCQNGGTCEDTSPGVRCLCPPTHTGSSCETEIISCAETSCEHGANCTDGSDGFHCDCPSGYSGLHCETDIDECASSPCQHASTCVDHVNGYTCLCGHHCGCANQASGPNCEKDPVTCDGFSYGDYIPDPDNCGLSHRCLGTLAVMERTQSGILNCTSDQVFVVSSTSSACEFVSQAPCFNYTYFHPQP